MPMWLYFFVVYFCGIWAFSSSRKHLLITAINQNLKNTGFVDTMILILCVIYHSAKSSQWNQLMTSKYITILKGKVNKQKKN